LGKDAHYAPGLAQFLAAVAERAQQAQGAEQTIAGRRVFQQDDVSGLLAPMA
jgi:DhnA family fructose-bisphosphate aldolase class Ia